MYRVINHYHEDPKKMFDFKTESRFLWDDHVSYTRNAIISILSNLPDIDAVGLRLIKNQDDIGSLITPYYSTEQVSTFVNLLKQHIVIATEVIKGTTGAEDSWRSNGNDLVLYMSQMNPMYWPVSIISPMWSDHLDLTIKQITSRRSGLWVDEIDTYDLNHRHINDFSDIFASGIIYQNIDSFCLKDNKWTA